MARALDANRRFLTARAETLRAQLDPRGKHPTRSAPVDAASFVLGDHEALPDELGITALARTFALTAPEVAALLVAVLGEVDPGLGACFARAQADASRPYATPALIQRLIQDADWALLTSDAPLRRHDLLHVERDGASGLSLGHVRADARVVDYAHGRNHLDARLLATMRPVTLDGEGELSAAMREQQASLLHHIEVAPNDEPLALFQLVGSDMRGKLALAAAVARRRSLQLFRTSLGLLPTDAEALVRLSRLWLRESHLLPAALFVGTESSGDAPRDELLERFLEDQDGIVFLDTHEPRRFLQRASEVIDVGRPTPSEQRVRWRGVLGDDEATARRLSGQFDLDFGTIDTIGRSVRLVAPGDAGEGPPSGELVWSACRRHARPRLEGLARRVTARARWGDLVVPDDALRRLHEIADQVVVRSRVYDDWQIRERMNRGLGITVLFAGPSGTGKTMAAEVLANALQLDLHCIDLSAVVSKYIGESEKNLRQVFDAAEGGGTILFFDEADALFGKRSEVRDSHDRYANIEVNYLLQRMEAYRGLAILATNLEDALDDAFKRRLRFSVEFPFPARAERRRIWCGSMPRTVPGFSRLDFDRLARFHLTGASIHNAAVHATFLAASNGGRLSMPLALRAVRDELEKLDQPINEADFLDLQHWGDSS